MGVGISGGLLTSRASPRHPLPSAWKNVSPVNPDTPALDMPCTAPFSTDFLQLLSSFFRACGENELAAR